MIGQEIIQARFSMLMSGNAFPRFSILVGAKGSGRKTLLSKYFPTASFTDTKVDSIRAMISSAYKVHDSMFVIPDADNMSNAAKNALLKVIEECPNNNRFVMTLEDEYNTLDTIRSRAIIYHMDRYAPAEILEYSMNLFGMQKLHKTARDIITEICETPGDVITLSKCGIEQLYDYVNLVVDNLTAVSLANAFKIPSKVALKDDDEGYDLRLFLKAYIKVCHDRISANVREMDFQEYSNWFDMIKITSKCIQQLRVKGINRQMLIDTWIIDIRKVWL